MMTRPAMPRARVRSMISSFENRPMVTFRVPIDGARVEPSDRFGAQTQGLFHEFYRAGAHEKSALRERNEIDGDEIRQSLSCRHDAFNAAHATIGIHIDMRSDKRAAMGNREHRMPTRLPCRIGQLRRCSSPSLSRWR